MVITRVAQEQEQKQEQEQEQEQKQEQEQEQQEEQKPWGVKTAGWCKTHGICNGLRSSFATAPTKRRQEAFEPRERRTQFSLNRGETTLSK